MDRRDFLRRSGLTLTGLLLSPWAVYAFPNQEGEVLIPFTDQPPKSSSGRVLLDWNKFDSFITPNDKILFRTINFVSITVYPKLTSRRGNWRSVGWLKSR